MTRERIIYSNTGDAVSRTVYISHLPRDPEMLTARLTALAAQYEYVALTQAAVDTLYTTIGYYHLPRQSLTLDNRIIFDLANMVEAAQIARVARKLES